MAKKARLTIVISKKKKVGFRGRIFLKIVFLILQEGLIILNVYVYNNSTSKHIKQKVIEMQGETDKSTMIVRDFNTPLSIT